MTDNIFRGIFDAEGAAVISAADFLICLGCALLCGLVLTGCYIFKSRYTPTFAATLALLPAVVAVVIMMVNGNVGAGVAVAGAFSLVRFRSVPGSAREIGAIFLAMGTGLVVGMGYLGYALLISILLGGVGLIYNLIGKAGRSKSGGYRVLRVTVPEDLDYGEALEPIIKELCSEQELTQVKTTNMGSLFRLTYSVKLRDSKGEKELVDRLRVRNGNLEITVSRQETGITEL